MTGLSHSGPVSVNKDQVLLALNHLLTTASWPYRSTRQFLLGGQTIVGEIMGLEMTSSGPNVCHTHMDRTLSSNRAEKLIVNIKNDPWDMLNNFCFHVYAQKSLFNVKASSSSREFRVHRAGSQLKI